jgi:hypothetical protein
VDNVNYTWDANGNLLNDGNSTYTYDPANRMTGVTQGGIARGRPSQCDPLGELPGCNSANYRYGGIPAAGSDINFNPREDFAESVAAYVFPDNAQKRAAKKANEENSIAYSYLYYSDYRTTTRYAFIDVLVTSDATLAR